MSKKVGAVLVLGGGIGGIQASLDLAESGYKVYLVEKKPSIGGRMAQLDKTFPTNDCAMCIMAPKLVDCGRHPNIKIITCAEIEKLQGSAGNFTVSVKKNPRFVDDEKCTGCGSCEENCPVLYKIYEPKDIKIELPPEKLDFIQKVLDRYRGERGVLLSILYDINAAYKYLPEDCLRYVSKETQIPLSLIYHIATFYHAFSLTPKGEYVINVCYGTACHIKGAPSIVETLERELKIKVGETTKDLKFTLETVRCLGCCGLAPVMTINENVHGRLEPAQIPEIINNYKNKVEEMSEAERITEILRKYDETKKEAVNA